MRMDRERCVSHRSMQECDKARRYGMLSSGVSFAES